MRRLLLVLVLAAGPAYADEAKGPHHEGDYGGVIPGEPKQAEPTKKGTKPKRPPPKGTLSWIGFEAKTGSAEVFLQSAGPFEVAQHVETGTLVVNLSGVTRLGQNTWRPIDTHFFDNPLSRITARRVNGAKAGKDHPAHGPGIELRIAFKNPKDAKEGTLRTAIEPDGMHYVYLSFAGTPQSDATLQEPEK